MAIIDNVKYEIDGRFKDLGLGKTHLSVRYEPDSRVVRVGACIADYTWEKRSQVIDTLLDFEDSHAGEFALEFDVLPLEAVTDPAYVEI
jgi:hypothetical protein